MRQREVRNRHSHLALADGQLRVGVQRDVLAARRERQARRAPVSSVEVRPALVDGAAGTVTLGDGRPFAIAGFTIRDRRMVEMDVIADPEGLRQMDLTILD
jgi:hypothetical protein